MSKTIAILLGAGVGGGIGWFIGSVVIEIIKLKEFPWEDYEYEDLDEDTGNDDETNLPKAENMTKKVKEKRTRNYTDYFEQIQRPDLAALTKKYSTGEEPIEEDANEEEWVDIPTEDEKEEEFQLVSLAEFANSELECVTLSYYEDDVVTDDKNVPIRKPEELVGEEALVSFGELSEDPNIVYVLNRKKNVIYEIVRTGNDYAKDSSYVQAQRRKRIKNKEEVQNAEEDVP